jgi:hypothetical protein
MVASFVGTIRIPGGVENGPDHRSVFDAAYDPPETARADISVIVNDAEGRMDHCIDMFLPKGRLNV